jgi:hypothetical protein
MNTVHTSMNEYIQGVRIPDVIAGAASGSARDSEPESCQPRVEQFLWKPILPAQTGTARTQALTSQAAAAGGPAAREPAACGRGPGTSISDRTVTRTTVTVTVNAVTWPLINASGPGPAARACLWPRQCQRASSGFLPTYDVVGIPTMSYLPDVAYDVVGQDLRCRMCTTSYVMTYNTVIDIRYRTYPTYDVVTYDVHTISSKCTMSYVQTTMSYGFHRIRYRKFWTAHRM